LAFSKRKPALFAKEKVHQFIRSGVWGFRGPRAPTLFIAMTRSEGRGYTMVIRLGVSWIGEFLKRGGREKEEGLGLRLGAVPVSEPEVPRARPRRGLGSRRS